MKQVTILGAGALGSHLVQFLRNEELYLAVVDFDRVEQKNLGSQFHSKQGLGRLKAQAIRELGAFLWGMRILPCTSRVSGDNVLQILGKDPNSLIVDCLDNGASRRLVQAHVRQFGIPCVHGALAADGAFGRVVWDKDFVVDDENVAGEPTCEAGEFLPFTGVVSSLLAHAVQTWARSGKQVGYSISPGGVQRI